MSAQVSTEVSRPASAELGRVVEARFFLLDSVLYVRFGDGLERAVRWSELPFARRLAVEPVAGAEAGEATQPGSSSVQVLAVADTAGVGPQLRRVVTHCLEAGLHVRYYPYSVMITTPADRRVMLFTVWPQADEPHTFVIWRAPGVLVKLWPGVSPQAAERALGPAGRTVISAAELEAIVERVVGLVASASPSTTE